MTLKTVPKIAATKTSNKLNARGFKYASKRLNVFLKFFGLSRPTNIPPRPRVPDCRFVPFSFVTQFPPLQIERQRFPDTHDSIVAVLHVFRFRQFCLFQAR